MIDISEKIFFFSSFSEFSHLPAAKQAIFQRLFLRLETIVYTVPFCLFSSLFFW